MAKSARSNAKKAVRAQRRQNLKASWQDDADKRRYEALAKAAASEPVLGYVAPEPAEDAMQEEGRGRTKPAKAKRDTSARAAMDTDAQPPAASSAGKRKKGFNVRGVQKKSHNKKKVSALWVSEFHKNKKGTLKGKKGG